MWTLYVITDTGRKVPHWTDTTRAKCRAMKPAGVRCVIERTLTAAEDLVARINARRTEDK